jgi:phage tail sheath gpL-like
MTISVVGVPSGYATAGDFLQINFGVGPSATGAGIYGSLLFGNKTSAGVGTVDTVVYGPSSSPPLQSEADVISLAGAGSEAHRLWLKFRATNKTTPLYLVIPAEPSGNQATATVAIATTATCNGTLRIFCGSESVAVAVASGDTPAVQGANAVIQINNKTSWPVTASGTSTITFTAKQKGIRGNEIRVRAVYQDLDGTIASTLTPNNTSTALTGGTTEDDWTNALATVIGARYYWNVSPALTVGSTTYNELVTQTLNKALPVAGLREVVIAAAKGTQGAASTIAANSGVNTARAGIAWQESSEWTAGEIAAHTAALLAQFYDLYAAYNFRDFGAGTVVGVDTSSFWQVPAQFTQTKWPTATSVETALNNGVFPIIPRTDGGTHLNQVITTKHKNGANFDYRSRPFHITVALDRFADELLATYRSEIGAKTLIDDPKPGEQILSTFVVSPRTIKALVYRLVDKYWSAGVFKNRDAIKGNVQVLRDPDNNSRVGIRIPAQVIDLLLQTVTDVEDNSTATA